ncbi:MAG TPA: hypothetical protein VD794_05605 [Flavisolibacter sp.]|nr:hypothetical protein [Flavisolibacter sp.]
MLVNENNSMPYMKSLVTCLNRIVADGYTEDFKVTDNGLEALQAGKRYKAEDVSVINFFRFEGVSDPEDNAILYVLQTTDGVKGTLIDAYGLYNDQRIGRFIKQVGAIGKRTTKS